MGCASSKLDDLPAVALCRERCAALDEAIHFRYAFAEAHFAYLESLKTVGRSLPDFFLYDLDNAGGGGGLPSPVLNLPPQGKADPQSYASPPQKGRAIHHSGSNSNSGSHLQFHSDSDSDDSVSDSPLHHHSGDASPLHPYGQINYPDHEPLGAYPGGGFMNTNMNVNYMKNQPTSSVSFVKQPMSPKIAHMGESSSSSSYYPYPYANQNPNSHSNYGYPGYGGGINGFFGSPPGSYGLPYPPPQGGPASSTSEASTSKAPPPPPPPPSGGSAWDFLYPFASSDNYYPPYTPSRDSREVREEEGIPDLEDEDLQEVVKEVYGNHKFVDGGGGGGGGKNYSKGVAEDQDDRENDSDYHTRPPSVPAENDPVEYEVHVVDKKVVDKEERPGDRSNASAFKARADSDVLREIQAQFERASEAGNELAKMLEVGKFPYKKNAAYQASSKMLHVVASSRPIISSQPSTSENAGSSSADKGDTGVDDDVGIRSGGLSSTLQKLFLWEKKLHEEVKVEEKMRVMHERKSQKLKHLDEKGAEAHKIDATRTLVRSLSTKIRIAIQVVDKISVKINKLRDEELWPQLNDFIRGLSRMWKSMLECHHNQFQAIGQAKRLDSIVSSKHFRAGHLEATSQLEHELLDWTKRYSNWVAAQKGYIQALNRWLIKCLLYEPEDTADGPVPFSPSRIGAPPIFIICNQWSQALDRISEREVLDSMRDFVSSVLQLWDRDKVEMRQRMMATRGREREVKKLERKDQKIQREVQALDKRLILVSGDGKALPVNGHAVYQSDTNKTRSLQVGLQHIFEAMERYTANSLKAYEELLQRIEEDRQDRLARDEEKIS
ncbi:protein ALTERED PHOSPHATE STARVATION RESPONSE 1 [Diospyros lotus]|uniref:protein ALTERED PHOSPHATE STARVATION RESPONSE 1 n=1 Tax=Diospyros lotus TaxID=55363 RepID=UPI002258B2A1|nr:protein ALTERED PHOSPHATE STARVATION RESPONSE 1 [Diospyros lotus]